MNCYRDPNMRAGHENYGRSEDDWAAYRGKYPDPTPTERYLIRDFLVKLEFEDEGFVEEQHQPWTQLKDRLRCPNLRSLLITFLRQVRQTKGYDVDDLHLDFSGAGVSPKWSLFVPRRLDEKKCYEEAMAASKFAVGEINGQLMRSYEVVSVEKLVSTTPNKYNQVITASQLMRSYEVVSVEKLFSTTLNKYNQVTTAGIMLLSFTAKAADVVDSFQAMLYPKLIPGDSRLRFHLREWKFNPTAPHLP